MSRYKDKDYLTARGVARVCLVSFTTVDNWLRAGLLADRPLPTGARRPRHRIRRRDVEEFIAEHGITADWSKL